MSLNRIFSFGSTKPLPLKGFPPGKCRIKIRPNAFTEVFIRTQDGIRQFIVKSEDGFWVPGLEIARNHRPAET